MATSNLELVLSLTGADRVGGALSKLGSTAAGLGKLALFTGAGAAIAGVAGLGASLVSAVGDARQAGAVMAQTENVIQSMGRTGQVSAAEIAEMSASLSAAAGTSLFDDADIQAGQNMLLTFGNITDTLPDATQAMVDMAAFTGTDMVSASTMLGKALNDPIAGFGALSRAGVSFTAEQKAAAAAMVEAGDIAGAQGIILEELGRQFGGAAQAAATADGGLAQFTAGIGEAKETIGAALLPALGQLGAALASPAVMGGIEAMATAIGTGLGTVITWLTETALPAVSTAFTTVLNLWRAGGDVASSFGERIGFVLDSLLGITDRIGPFQTFGIVLAEVFSSVQAGAAAAFTWLAETALPAVSTAFTVTWPVIQAAVATFIDWFTGTAWPGLQAAFDWLTGTALPAVTVAFSTAFAWVTTTGIPALITGFQTVQAALTPIVEWIGGNLGPVMAGFGAAIVAVVVPALITWATTTYATVAAQTALAVSTAAAWLPVIATVAAVGVAVGALYYAWQQNFGGIQEKTAAVIGYLQGTVWPWLVEAFNTVSSVVVPALQSAFATAWPAIQSAVSAVYEYLSGTVWPWIQEAFNTTATKEIPAIANAFRTAWPVIQQSVMTVYTWMSGTAWPWLQTAFQNLIQWVGEVRDRWNADFATIRGYVETVQTTWQTVSTAIQTATTAVIGYVGDVKARWDSDIAAIRGFIQTIQTTWQTVSGGVSAAIETVKGYIIAFKVTAETEINTAVGYFTALPGRITSAVGNLGSLLVQTGRDVVQGLINGITEKLGAALETVRNLAGQVVSAAAGALGVKSPSTVFYGIGADIMRGWRLGMTDNAQLITAPIDKIARDSAGSARKAAGVIAAPPEIITRAQYDVIENSKEFRRDTEKATKAAVQLWDEYAWGVGVAKEGTGQLSAALDALAEKQDKRASEAAAKAAAVEVVAGLEIISRAQYDVIENTKEHRRQLEQMAKDVVPLWAEYDTGIGKAKQGYYELATSADYFANRAGSAVKTGMWDSYYTGLGRVKEGYYEAARAADYFAERAGQAVSTRGGSRTGGPADVPSIVGGDVGRGSTDAGRRFDIHTRMR